MRVGEGAERQSGKQEAGDRHSRRDREEPAITLVVADKRNNRIDDCQGQREDEREMTGFDDHG